MSSDRMVPTSLDWHPSHLNATVNIAIIYRLHHTKEKDTYMIIVSASGIDDTCFSKQYTSSKEKLDVLYSLLIKKLNNIGVVTGYNILDIF